MRITGIGIFATSRPGWLSWITRRVTGGPQAHLGLIFFTDERRWVHDCVYMEALFRRGVGPARDGQELLSWRDREKGRRLWWLALHDVTPEQARAVWEDCQGDIGRVGYYELQLVAHWVHERIGRWLGWDIRRTPELVTCSEWVAEQLGEHTEYDLRDRWRDVWDEVTPASGWSRACELRLEHWERDGGDGEGEIEWPQKAQKGDTQRVEVVE